MSGGKAAPAGSPTISIENIPAPYSAGDRLNSWKEIAVHLNRDVRTVRRWEKKQGLPVHRHQHQKSASVYAYRSELDVWWEGEQAGLVDEPVCVDETGTQVASASRAPLVVSVQGVRSSIIPWAMAGVLVAMVATLSYFLLRYNKVQQRVTAGKIMLAVLPFENLTGDSAQEFVVDGFTEEMITQVSQLQHDRLGVIARTSAMAFKGSKRSIGEIGHELGVDYILEGSVRRWEDRVRVTAQLIQTRDQTHVWAENYESDRRDILRLQSEITQDIARQIDLQLLPKAAQPPASRRSVDPQAHELYLEGRHYLNQRSREDLKRSVELFKQAIAKDKGYAAAYAGLADAYNLIAFYGFDPRLDGVSEAKVAAQKALQLDDSLAAGHAALAYTEFIWQEDWSLAEKEFRRALELDDNYVSAHQWYALYLAATANMDEALGQMQYAQRLDPLSSAAHISSAYMYYFARDYEHAIQQASLGLQLNPNSMVAHAVIGWAYTEQKNYPDAIHELQTAAQLSGGATVYQCALARAYALSGNIQEATKIITQMEAVLEQPRGAGSAIAAAYLAFRRH